MRGALGPWAIATLALAGCSSPSSPGASDDAGTPTPVDVSDYVGSDWNGTVVTTATCGTPAPGTSYGVVGLSFVAQGSGISGTLTTEAGCTFDFAVSRATATLSNAPVKCTSTVAGIMVETTYSAVVLTNSDGQSLTGTFTAMATADGSSCTSTGTLTATR